ncbi:MAG: putative monocarboxylate transporter mch1 [Vezdaea acicularis]|nr:MAG: putative monocarboxylate transporter mch1 [Vezdaea acicularis]
MFLSRLRYTQLQVNIVSIAAELSMYLPVPIFGYLCDRFSPSPLSLFSGTTFGLGYLLAAFTYRSGPPPSAEGEGWPFGLMVLAFAGVGMGTSCMYLSAVTTCAKNFGRGEHAGMALALPIAAFGLSGLWQSQVGSRLLYERLPDGGRGNVDVFRYFLFLSGTLFAAGCIGTIGLRVVDEGDLIDEGIEELERSGLLTESEHFIGRENGYGSIDHEIEEEEDRETLGEEEKRKKTWFLNQQTSSFLKDPTMWFLAGGFFLVTGPGEAFINNLGTIINTLSPPHSHTPITSAATHVSLVALSSTIARILTGTLTDLFAPRSAPRPLSAHSSLVSLPPKPRFTISRMTFLLISTALLFLGSFLLAAGIAQDHADRFWIVSTLVGAGYGATFSLVPIVISVVWGVENFGTNWGCVAMVPAFGAAVWGIVYSAVYQGHVGSEGGECFGIGCYQWTFGGVCGAVGVAGGLWYWAWRGNWASAWVVRGIAI